MAFTTVVIPIQDYMNLYDQINDLKKEIEVQKILASARQKEVVNLLERNLDLKEKNKALIADNNDANWRADIYLTALKVSNENTKASNKLIAELKTDNTRLSNRVENLTRCNNNQVKIIERMKGELPQLRDLKNHIKMLVEAELI